MKWDDKAIAKLRRLRGMNWTVREIAREFGVSYPTISSAIRNHATPESGLKTNPKYAHKIENLETLDCKELPSAEKILKHIIKGQELVREFDPRQREVFPSYKTDKWVGVVFQGDWHFEHFKTDLPSLIADLEAIGGQEDCFYVFTGDIGDWGDIRFKDFNMPSIIIPAHLRYKALFYLVSKIKNLLAVITGCHDDWLNNRGYYDIIRAVKNKKNELGVGTYYLGYGGTINFKVGKAEYRIAAFHKLPGHSMHNPFHSCMRYLKERDSSADIVVASHRHDLCGVQDSFFQHAQRLLIRTGSHQHLTDYAWKEGFSGAVNKSPMVLLNGAKKQMFACTDYKRGLEELKRLNKGVKK